MPAPPEAKLTPVKKDDALFLAEPEMSERYGGEVGNPTFSAVHEHRITKSI